MPKIKSIKLPKNSTGVNKTAGQTAQKPGAYGPQYVPEAKPKNAKK